MPAVNYTVVFSPHPFICALHAHYVAATKVCHRLSKHRCRGITIITLCAFHLCFKQHLQVLQNMRQPYQCGTRTLKLVFWLDITVAFSLSSFCCLRNCFVNCSCWAILFCDIMTCYIDGEDIYLI